MKYICETSVEQWIDEDKGLEINDKFSVHPRSVKLHTSNEVMYSRVDDKNPSVNI